jgi:purine-binding chemotaxis protein CheW
MGSRTRLPTGWGGKHSTEWGPAGYIAGKERIVNSATAAPPVQPGTPGQSAPSSRGGKYLTFALGKEEYGLQILKVREIIGYMEITAVPGTPSYTKGVINLRGQVIAVVDLRAKFGMASQERTEQTCIIVVEIRGVERKHSVGIIVDHVSEVLSIADQQIEDPPHVSGDVDGDFILGMGKIGQSVKILLDIDRVLAGAQGYLTTGKE